MVRTFSQRFELIRILGEVLVNNIRRLEPVYDLNIFEVPASTSLLGDFTAGHCHAVIFPPKWGAIFVVPVVERFKNFTVYLDSISQIGADVPIEKRLSQVSFFVDDEVVVLIEPREKN